MSQITLRNQTAYPALFVLMKGQRILARLPALESHAVLAVPIDESFAVVANDSLSSQFQDLGDPFSVYAVVAGPGLWSILSRNRPDAAWTAPTQRSRALVGHVHGCRQALILTS